MIELSGGRIVARSRKRKPEPTLRVFADAMGLPGIPTFRVECTQQQAALLADHYGWSLLEVDR